MAAESFSIAKNLVLSIFMNYFRISLPIKLEKIIIVLNCYNNKNRAQF